MSDNENPREGDAPLLPGGEPELSGTGPQGAYPDGSPTPDESDAHNPAGAGGRRVGHLEGNEASLADVDEGNSSESTHEFGDER